MKRDGLAPRRSVTLVPVRRILDAAGARFAETPAATARNAGLDTRNSVRDVSFFSNFSTSACFDILPFKKTMRKHNILNSH